jgi:hypothetical protein
MKNCDCFVRNIKRNALSTPHDLRVCVLRKHRPVLVLIREIWYMTMPTASEDFFRGMETPSEDFFKALGYEKRG